MGVDGQCLRHESKRHHQRVADDLRRNVHLLRNSVYPSLCRSRRQLQMRRAALHVRGTTPWLPGHSRGEAI